MIVCCIIVTVSVAVTLAVINSEESCSSAPFADLPVEFYLQETFFTARATSNVLDVNNNTIGAYATRPSVDTVYTYHDSNGDVVAEIDKGVFSWTYSMVHCDGAGNNFTVERTTLFTFTNIQYNLTRNGVPIGYPNEELLFTCRPDVVIADANGTLLATIDRTCSDSLWLDHWHVKNYAPALIDSYVLGAIAYLTTQDENASD